MPQDTLSKREREVLAELRNGGRVPTIARTLSISPTTVRNHLQRIFWKLGVHSQSELVEHVRAHPEILADADAEARYWQANERLAAEIEEIIGQRWGPGVFHEVVRRALPLGPEGREEWLARLAIWSRGDSPDSEIARKRAREMETWRNQAEERILKAQGEGWIRTDIEPGETLEQLFSLMVGVAFQLIGAEPDPRRKDAQIRVVEAFLDDLIIEGSMTRSPEGTGSA
ncbi:MAG TPA: hypothetical protein ENI85_08050 [Deltaproteobacteria bacterium]|nr:hypothetical protein [Deltaproteobacteria bacterium]